MKPVAVTDCGKRRDGRWWLTYANGKKQGIAVTDARPHVGKWVTIKDGVAT